MYDGGMANGITLHDTALRVIWPAGQEPTLSSIGYENVTKQSNPSPKSQVPNLISNAHPVPISRKHVPFRTVLSGS